MLLWLLLALGLAAVVFAVRWPSADSAAATAGATGPALSGVRVRVVTAARTAPTGSRAGADAPARARRRRPVPVSTGPAGPNSPWHGARSRFRGRDARLTASLTAEAPVVFLPHLTKRAPRGFAFRGRPP